MRFGSLYFRMLIGFVLVQAVAIILIFSLVRVGKIRPPFARHAEDRATAMNNLIKRELRGASTLTPERQDHLNSMLKAFADAFQGYAWVTTPQDDVIGKSFPGSIPLTGEEEVEKFRPTRNGSTTYLMKRRDHVNMYLVSTIMFNNEPLTVHVLHRWRKQRVERWFMEGILLTSIIAAFLLIPVSRRITRPLKELTASAEQVAQGDFSPRVKVKWKGEMSILANTFNRMAKSLEKMVRGGRELTANLSHELRSPLTRIRISQQIMQERIESGRTDGVKKHLHKMEAEIDHMDGLIDKILKLSKLDLQESPAHDDIADIPKMLEEAITLQHPLMQEKNISVRRTITPSQGYPCHKEDIRIVLDNVLTNAIKYSHENATICVASHVDNETIVIAVTNPYSTLSDTELETVFVPFKRLGYDAVEGNGLGLAFAKKIIEDHGGTMTASNAPDGFCMTIRLPLA